MNNQTENNENINNISDEIIDKNQDEESKEENNKEIEDTISYKVPLEEIYINYPNTLVYYKQPYTLLMYNSRDALVGFCYDFSVDYTGTNEKVFEYLIDYFLEDASTTSRANLFDAVGATKIISSEKVVINALESYKIKETAMPNEESSGEYIWPCHLYGYTFVIDNVPCAVIGIVSTEEQEAELIAEYDALVDQIAQTVRTTP